jgi:hypothetical protein
MDFAYIVIGDSGYLEENILMGDRGRYGLDFEETGFEV